MNDVLLEPKRLPPVCMTLPQLKRLLGPITAGYAWGEGTIEDLWRMGAPMPPKSGQVWANNERLIVPSQLMAWLEDVLKRQGRPLDESAKLYAQMIKEGG